MKGKVLISSECTQRRRAPNLRMETVHCGFELLTPLRSHFVTGKMNCLVTIQLVDQSLEITDGPGERVQTAYRGAGEINSAFPDPTTSSPRHTQSGADVACDTMRDA